MSHRHTRIAVALGGLAAFALAIVLPRWAVVLIFGWLLIDALIVALIVAALYRLGQQRETVRQRAAERPDVAMLVQRGFHSIHNEGNNA